jgi:hypothetical protein
MMRNGLSILLVAVMALGTIVCPCEVQASVMVKDAVEDVVEGHAHHQDQTDSAIDADCVHSDCETPCTMLSATPRSGEGVVALAFQTPELDDPEYIAVFDIVPYLRPLVVLSTWPVRQNISFRTDTPVRRFDRLLD